MPVDPMVVAAGLNAVGTLAGNLIGGSRGGMKGGNMRNVREAQQAAIAGKVKAAEKFGISKLYALGAPTISPAVDVGGSGPSLGETISQMGADVSRAVAAGQTGAERQLQVLALEKAGLENDFLRGQIASLAVRTAKEVGPPMPGLIPEKVVPPQRTSGLNVGTGFRTNPNFSDAQTIEDRHGELAGSLYGVVSVPADMWQHAKDWWNNPATWVDWPFGRR